MDLQTQRLMMAAAGAVGGATYVDDVFSTYLFKGNSSTQTITNGIDLSGKGGLVWSKTRGVSDNHRWTDTERGVNKSLCSDLTSAEYTLSGVQGVSQFNSNGFVSGLSDSSYNDDDISSWTFRKAPGFFDVVTYTGNGSNRTIAHSLGSVPGMIMVKCTSESRDWAVYHRNLEGTSGNENNAGTAIIFLNTTEGRSHNDEYWNDTEPTSTHFSVGVQNGTNKNGATYVAYLFAGGESTAATAVSVDFDGNDHLDVATSSDLDLGTGDFTIEFWAKFDGTNTYLECCFDGRHPSNTNNGIMVARWHSAGHENKVSVYMGGFLCEEQGSSPNGQWNHYAVVRASGTTSLYKNGKFEDSFSDSNDWSNDTWNIACLGNDEGNHANAMRGWISNFRVVKGTAVYTGNFRTPTTPLTAITNTKLLCCQSSTVTASTGVTLSANGNPAASTDSPFYDPTGFVFGENEDQNVIKCGSYVGTGSAGFEVNLGWEPSWIIVKSASAAENWEMYDSMRGLAVGGDAERLKANTSDAEDTNSNWFSLTANGFIVNSTSGTANTSGDTYIFCAIRRPDGYVGKPPELGTDVFNMVYGTGTAPTFAPGFPVDFTFLRRPGTTENWTTAARLIQGKYLFTNTNAAQSNDSNIVFDYNNGFHDGTGLSTYLSWSWKRHAGFDVVAYTGTSVHGTRISHSLNKIPEMLWVKRRDYTYNWMVGHKGLNGGTNPWEYSIILNSDSAEADTHWTWNDTAPTSTHFTLRGDSTVNGNGYPYLGLLFASVDGISKVGSYAGSSSNVSVTTGFQPRFIIIKRNNNQGQWAVFDTVRGLTSSGSNGDKLLYLNANNAESDGTYIDLSSTGFTVLTGWVGINNSESEYIYYAHS